MSNELVSAEFIAEHLERCRSLLAPERAKVVLTETAPEHDPASINALAGLGFEATDPAVKISVYIFENANQHPAAVAQLLQMTPQVPGMRVLHGSNGPLLFFGHTQIEGAQGRTAKYRLSGIASAFAGDEPRVPKK